MSMLTKIPLALALFLAHSLQPTVARLTGEYIAAQAAHYQNAHKSEFSQDAETAVGASFFTGYALGFLEAGNEDLFCFPADLNPIKYVNDVAREMARMVYPDNLETPAAWLFFSYNIDRFPCDPK